MNAGALIVSGPAAPWEAAGFSFVTDRTADAPLIPFDNYAIEVDPHTPPSGGGQPEVLGIRTGVSGASSDLDGIAVNVDSHPIFHGEAPDVGHRNFIYSVDHLVVATPNHERSKQAFAACGLDHRKSVGDPRGGDLAQSFFLADKILIELVGPYDDTAEGPSSIWGLSLVSNDIAATADFFGDRCTAPKPAIQAGRLISTLDTLTLGLPLRVSIMTPRA